MSNIERNDKQLWLSYSRISAYKECGYFYKKAYVEKEKLDIKGNYHTALGNGIHKVLEEMFDTGSYTLNFMEQWWEKVCYKGYTEKNGQEVLPILEDPEYEFPNGDDEKKMFFFHGRKLIRQFYHSNKHEFGVNSIVNTELNFKIPVGNGKVVLNGYIDRIDRRPDGKLVVVDYKTGKERGQEDVDEDLQLSLYAFAVRKLFGENEGELYLHFIKSGNKVKTIRTREHFDKLLETVKYVKSGIENEQFEPKKGNQCRYCYFECPLGINQKNREDYLKKISDNQSNKSNE